MDKRQNECKIAAQTLGSSVANAIDFLWEQTDLSEFKVSEEATHFIKQDDMISDMLNNRNPLQKVTKHMSPKKTYLCGWNSVIKYCHTCYQWKIKDKNSW